MSMYGKKPPQYCKVISLQLIKVKEKKKKNTILESPSRTQQIFCRLERVMQTLISFRSSLMIQKSMEFGV